MDIYAFLLLFLVTAAIAAPLVYVYAKREANPRLRPAWGEVLAVSAFAFVGCVAMSIGFSVLFGLDGTAIDDFRYGRTKLNLGKDHAPSAADLLQDEQRRALQERADAEREVEAARRAEEGE